MPRGQGGTLSGFTPLSTPNAPTGLSVSTSIGSATVSFEPPADTGDAPITSFVVTAIDESTGESTGVVGSSSPISISPGGGTFKIRAQAVNGFGPGRLTEFDTGNAIFSGAELYAWGANGNGELGLNDTVRRSSPAQVGALGNWSKVTASTQAGFAQKTAGSIWFVGGRSSEGQNGLNDTIRRSSPVQIGALTTWADVSSQGTFAVARSLAGSLFSWGSNYFGQLGDNATAYRSSPVQIGALTDWAQVSAGSYHAAAVKANNTLWTWGANSDGRLGQNDTVIRSSPVQVGALSEWAQVSAGTGTAAIKTNGTLWAWGANNSGNVGDGTTVNRSSPVQIGALTNWTSVFLGSSHTLALSETGQLYAWGYNGQGRLGDGTGFGFNRSSPVQIGALTNWAQVAAGGHSSSVKTDGTLWMWGDNGSGQLGDETVTSRSSPVQIGALTNWVQVSAGGSHTTALLGVL